MVFPIPPRKIRHPKFDAYKVFSKLGSDDSCTNGNGGSLSDFPIKREGRRPQDAGDVFL